MNKIVLPIKYFDQHVHSSFSADSKTRISAYLKKANSLGLNYLTFTEHVDLNAFDGKNWNFNPKRQAFYISKYQIDNHNIHILQGIEMGYSKKHLSLIKNILTNHPYDVINLSLHIYQNFDFYKKQKYLDLGIDNCLRIYFEEMINMLDEFENFDVLCHFDYAFKTAHSIDTTLKISSYSQYLVKIMKLVISKDKTLEINTKVQETINDEEHLRYILRLYKSMGGVYLTLSSDAHKVKRLCSNFAYYMQIIKEEGFEFLSYFIKRKRYKFYL